MMRNFDYHEPTALNEACQLLKRYKGEAVVFAGGSYLTLLMKQGLLRPEALINIKKIPELGGIQLNNEGSLTIGALVTHHELETSQVVHRGWAVISQAEKDVANIRVRNMATVGGNLASGEPLTDLPCVFLALDARLNVVGADRERTIPIHEFFVDYYQTVLFEDEILTMVVVPPLLPHTGVEYLRFTSGSVVEKPSVGVAVRVTLDPEDHKCKEVRVALGCVSATPMRAREAEGLVIGQPFNETVIDACAVSASRECSPLDDLRGSESYKRAMVRVMVRRALMRAQEHARKGARNK